MIAGLLAGCGGGGGSDTPPPPANTAPVATMLLSGAVTAGGAGADVSASAGADLVMSGAGSTDGDGDAITFKWTIISKPATSNIKIVNDAAAQLTIRADVGGDYVFRLRVTDSKGAYTEKDAKVAILPNQAPVTTVAVTATFTGETSVKPAADVTIGAAIVLDAAASTDADGDLVNVTWTMLEKPAASKAAFLTDGKVTRFSADAAGTFRVRARGTDPKGAFRDTIYVFNASNHPPQTVVLTSVSAGTSGNGEATINAATGYMVAFNGSTSADPDGTALTHAWTIASKPAGSSAVLTSASGPTSQITPDVLGTYVVKMVVTNAGGAASTYTTTVVVNNRRPLASLSTNATPIALPTGPAVRMPVGTQLTLRGTGSTDADGDTLTYSWALSSKPAGSSSVLSTASEATTQLTTDASGTYVIVLRVTDTSGAFSEQTLMVESGNYAPVAVLDKNRVSALAGSPVTASAAMSFDEDGDTLTYNWTLDARPSGSAAVLGTSNTNALTLTPDVAGTYMATVTVSDGKGSSSASFYIKALSSVATNVSLNFAPLEARYSQGLDKMVVVASNPNALKIIDPFTGVIKTVVLPMAVKAMQLSPDGKLAAVLHENILSLVDLDAAILVRSSTTGGSHTDAFVMNSGITYLVGQTGGQWVDEKVTVIDGRSGANLTASLAADMLYGHGRFYGTQYGIYAPLKNRVLLMSQGLSPADIDYFTIDPASGKVLASGESPYHGDYNMSTPLFLSANQDILFTSSGTYFNSETLRYAGSLSLTGGILSLSHSGDADEALVLQGNISWYSSTSTYRSEYLRFTGALFLPDAPISLPVISGEQSYGLKIFHSANANHVALVQTGTATQNGVGVKYYVTTR